MNRLRPLNRLIILLQVGLGRAAEPAPQRGVHVPEENLVAVRARR